MGAYNDAVAACALQQDFDSWVEGDETMIGEKGINISGGQKQRIALARAICSDAQVFLLDAPLSGLDVIVAKQVFEEAILKQAESRLVIMTDCTYKPEVLTRASRIIVVDRGETVFDGDYVGMCREHVIDVIRSHSQSTAMPKSEDANAAVAAMSALKVAGSLDSSKKAATTMSSLKGDSTTTSSGSTKTKRSKQTDDITPDAKGSRSYDSYIVYAKSCGLLNISTAILLSVVAYAAGATGDYQIAFWTDGSYGAARFLLLYGLLSMAVIILHLARYFMYSYSGIVASKRLHDSLLTSILGAKFAFFTDTPSGRIASRFSVDFDTIDFSIPGSFASLADALLGIITGVGVVVLSSPIYLFVVILLTWKYLQVQGQYRKVSKELKKIESGSKSPLFSHFREVLNGLETARGFRIESKLCDQHHELLDASIRARLNWDFANRYRA
jgi:ABC-type multidrug transport system fused ATPase/permease subunit